MKAKETRASWWKKCSITSLLPTTPSIIASHGISTRGGVAKPSDCCSATTLKDARHRHRYGRLRYPGGKTLHPQQLIGADISEGMMEIGRKKVEKENLQDIISFKKEDCLHLSFPDETFDAVTAAFGIRNFQNLDQGLKEMCRVLKKGGHLSIVELTHPVKFPMKQLFRIYSHTVLPIYGKLISKDQSAYSYLTATIEAFPQGETMMEVLKKAGFEKAEFKRLTFGICTMYFATK